MKTMSLIPLFVHSEHSESDVVTHPFVRNFDVLMFLVYMTKTSKMKTTSKMKLLEKWIDVSVLVFFY